MFDPKGFKTKTIDLIDSSSRSVLLKKILLGVLVLALSFFTSGYVFELTGLPGSETRVNQIAMLVLAIFWLCFSLISGLVFSTIEFFVVVLIGFAMVFWPFSRYLESWLFAIFLALGIFLIFFARQAGRNIVENSIKLKANHILSASLPKIVLILSLLMSLVFWSLRFGSGFNLKTSDVKSMTNSFSVFYPGYSEKTTVGELIKAFTEKQSSGLMNNLLPSGVPDAFKDSLKKEAEKSVLSQISSFFGRQVLPRETVVDLIHTWIKSYYDKLSENTKRTADYVVFLIVFVFWFSIFQVFSFVIYGVFWLVLKLLLLLKVVKVGIVTVEKETLTI